MINKIKISLEFLPSQKVNRKFVSLKGMPVENISLKILSNPWVAVSGNASNNFAKYFTFCFSL
jgi:hypothetical protein